jgi:lysophospholipase L1-like esterase
MKKTLFLLLVSVSSFAQQIPWASPSASTISGANKLIIQQGAVTKTATVSQLLAFGIDTTKVGRIEQGRGTAPIFMYFNGTAWVRNDTAYIPRRGANNLSGNLINNTGSFLVGAGTSTTSYATNSSLTNLVQNTGATLGAMLTLTPSPAVGLGVLNYSDSDRNRFFNIIQGSSSTPNQSFEFSKGLGYYTSDYRAQMTADNTIPDIGKVKQLISDSMAVGGGGSGTLTSVYSANSDISIDSSITGKRKLTLNSGTGANQIVKRDGSGNIVGYIPTTLTSGSINIGDGTNTAFPRTLSGDVTVSNLGVQTLATVNSNVGTFGSATQSSIQTVNAKGLTTAISNVTITPAIGSVTGLGTGVATYLGSSSITNFGTISGSQTANKVLSSPDGTNGNILARDLKRRDLKNTLTTIGTVASDDYSVDYLSTRYTTIGSNIWSVSGGKLNAAGGSTKTLGNYVGYNYYGKINSKKETISIDITVGTLTSTSFGIGIGLQGASLAVQGAILLDNVNTGRLAFYFNNSTATEDMSDGALSLSAGDVVNLRYTLLQNTLILVATNTTLSTRPSVTYTKELINNNSTTYRTPNAGFATIYSLGGSHSVDNFSVVNNASKYARILFIDDSKGAGSHQSNEGQSYTSFLARKIYGQIEVLAGGGNYIADNNATEALAYEADYIFIGVGTNDVIRGDAAATIMASYATLESSLSGYTRGTNLFYVNLPPNNTVSTVSLNSSMATTFGDNVCKIYSTFVNNGLSTIQAKYSNDGTHLNGEGKRIQANIIYDYGVRKGLWQTGENANMGGNEVHSNGAYTGLGGMNIVPQYAAHIYTFNKGNQFGISPTYNSNDGLALWSTLSGNAVLGAGCNTSDGSTITNTHTSPMRLSLNNGDFKLSSNAGLSIGASLTPTNRLQYTNSSNTWEQINSYAIFGGNNATTNGNTVFRQTNAGADANALIMIGNGVTTGAGVTSSGFGLGGGNHYYIGNGTRPILVGLIGFDGTSTAGSEDGSFYIATKPSVSSVVEAFRINASQNIGIGTIANIVHKLDVWSSSVGIGVRNYNSVALGSTSGGVFLAQSPIATAANQRMAVFAGGGYDGTNTYANARIQVFSSESHTLGVAQGGYLTFETTNNGANILSERMRIGSDGNIGIGVTVPTSTLHLKAGTTTASTAPLKFTSGTLLTTAEAGAVEFLTDKFYGTITTGAARKEFIQGDNAITEGVNIIIGSTTGTKIGTATTQKIAFYNSTPIVQPNATTDLGTVLSNIGLRGAGTAYPITTSGAVTMSNATVALSGGTLTGAATQNVYNTISTTVNAFGASTTATIFGNSTAAVTYNIGANATATATTKAINIGTSGASGSTTNITLGSSVSGSTSTTTINGTFKSTGFTVATLPTGSVGLNAYVTDALAPAYNTTVVGGGAVTIKVFHNGTNWICN